MLVIPAQVKSEDRLPTVKSGGTGVPLSARLFRRCDCELIAHVLLSGHAYSFGFQVALLLFRLHWPPECNFAVLNEDFDVASIGG